MTDIFNRQRSVQQFETVMKQKKQLADSGYVRNAKPVKRHALSNFDIEAQFQAAHISDIGGEQYKEEISESQLIEICILSEFAIPSRSGMRLNDKSNLTSANESSGGGFKIPVSVLLERTGVGVSTSGIAVGNILITALENADGKITQLRLMASPDTDFLKTGEFELIFEDASGTQSVARFTPPERSLMIFPYLLQGPAVALRLKSVAFHA